jgi:hypothetical protein
VALTSMRRTARPRPPDEAVKGRCGGGRYYLRFALKIPQGDGGKSPTGLSIADDVLVEAEPSPSVSSTREECAG